VLYSPYETVKNKNTRKSGGGGELDTNATNADTTTSASTSNTADGCTGGKDATSAPEHPPATTLLLDTISALFVPGQVISLNPKS
jgi:hypothetical protein